MTGSLFWRGLLDFVLGRRRRKWNWLLSLPARFPNWLWNRTWKTLSHGTKRRLPWRGWGWRGRQHCWLHRGSEHKSAFTSLPNQGGQGCSEEQTACVLVESQIHNKEKEKTNFLSLYDNVATQQHTTATAPVVLPVLPSCAAHHPIQLPMQAEPHALGRKTCFYTFCCSLFMASSTTGPWLWWSESFSSYCNNSIMHILRRLLCSSIWAFFKTNLKRISEEKQSI